MNILVVDDDALSLDAVVDFVGNDLGFAVDACTSGAEALERLEQGNHALVICDVRMPGIQGHELLRRVKAGPRPNTAVVLMTAYADIESVIDALRAGAEDYIQKPLNIEELAVIIDRVRERVLAARPEVPASRADDAELERPTRFEVSGHGPMGVFSEALRRVVMLAERLHPHRSVPVLIEGETGTGKELVARLLHRGPNGEEERPFVAINCSAISPSLFESELFGYERGAFTGAAQAGKAGQIERAQGGTLFLDEIGDLPAELQPKFLRVLQQREMVRVGGTTTHALDVRVVCATNRNLEEMVARGSFRRDLFHRLNVGRICIPPLRERADDILPLAQMALEDFASRYRRLFRFIGEDAREALLGCPWEGNAREVINTIERAVLLNDAVVLRARHLALDFTSTGADSALPKDGMVLRPGHFVLPAEGLDLDALEQEVVRKALAMCEGNKSKTADFLRISRSALYTRLARQ